ncbi:oligosaccharide amylase [Paenibacillus cellulosilyticus]|uniref:Oligosaccharide amylase n=1 Tax=Paenibacillus cellulosilyticus TaxID=375489 RepID=A0A2V2YXK1_9BACL|nr:glycoside hydrolase family 15 protein [Paenibacillus cellulosilyticus]PWW06176.1 oligosaccharide amylase [Paenibacillus cellulosilyticus]QKS43057.1 glycoside hydrolase family 15 [Paenibacillus cellulosilyticus]
MNPNKPYLIDAIVGNSKMLAALGRTGTIYRLWWPHIDFPQHADAVRSGIRFEGQTEWLDDSDSNWSHTAEYVEKTNIFEVQSVSSSHSVAIQSRYFAVPGHDLLVLEHTFTNQGNQPVDFEWLIHSSFHVCESELYNTTMFEPSHDALVHYRSNHFFAVSSANVCTKFQAGHAWHSAQHGELNGSVIDMQPDGALAWKIQALAPGDAATLPVYIAAGHDRNAAYAALTEAKSKPSAEWVQLTVDYWHRYLEAAAPCPTDRADVKRLYERSQLMFKLMSDEQTGSIVAAPEFDETFSRCGGYAYCWGRDAAFITTAIDKAGLHSLSDSFYEWALTAQDEDGSWQQRHYHDGSLAPQWGLQIDEGASIIWGMWQHYSTNNNQAFSDRVWPAVRKGADFLLQFIDPETNLPCPSNDLWEERHAEHTYSAAAVFGALRAAASFGRLQGDQARSQRWDAAADRMAAAINSDCWNEDKGSFFRGRKLTVSAARYADEIAKGKAGMIEPGLKDYSRHVLEYDSIVDISLLGLSIPFAAVSADDPRMAQTANTIEQLLTVPGVGGIKRYEDDNYIGGNPWILTTLWLAHYRIETGEYEAAHKLLQWAIDHQTETGLLPEQIDKTTGKTAWVVPLTWSHAMFILAVTMLAERGQI